MTPKREASPLVQHEPDSKTPCTDPESGQHGGTAELEDVDLDDLCPICHLLLYRPVTTRCRHTLCESCMAHWADVSLTSSITIVSLDEQPISTDTNEVEAKCPMCRTLTTTAPNE